MSNSQTTLHTLYEEPHQVPVHAYFAQDPYEDEFETEWLEGLPGFSLAVEDPMFDETNQKLLADILKITEAQFKRALHQAWPLLKNSKISSLQIAVDLVNTLMHGQGLAAYFYDHTDTFSGKYVFFLSRYLLEEYTKMIQNNAYKLSAKSETTWLHEFIHLIDDENLKNSSSFQHSDSKDDLLKFYLLCYRHEGIADLPYTLKGHNDVKSVRQAFGKFNDEFVRVKTYLFKPDVNEKQIMEPFLNSYSFYELGPWLVMDMLLRSDSSAIQEHVQKCISMLSSNSTIDDQDILTLVRYALSIDNDAFLKMTQELVAENIDLT